MNKKFNMVYLLALIFLSLPLMGCSAGPEIIAVPAGTILPFSGAQAPNGYYKADGSVLNRSQDQALCQVLAGQFVLPDDPPGVCRLPDLRGRVAVGAGTGRGFSKRDPGDVFGAETQTLSTDHLPAHEHPLNEIVYRFFGHAGAFSQNANNAVVAGCPYGPGDTGDCEGPGRKGKKVKAAANEGGGQSFPVSQPSLVVNYIVKR